MMNTMFRKQLVGFAGVVPAFVTLALVWRYRYAFGSFVPAADDVQNRLAYALTWLLLPGLSLLIGVLAAARRGFYRDAIDGTRAPASPALEINLRYNTNTVEQVLLAAIAVVGLALRLPHGMLLLIPIMATLFFVGRMAFFVGYLINPMGRAYGMALTAVPTVIAYGWLTWRLLEN